MDSGDLQDTERPTVSTYQPPNSARGLGLEFEVHLTFTEPIFPGKVSSARHIELYQTGDAANAGQLLERCETPRSSSRAGWMDSEIIDFSDQRVALQTDVFKVQLDGLEPNKFYCLVLPPLSLSDREGNNFTGIPRNHYIFGTSSDTTVEEIAWTESLFIIIGIVLVVGYFVMTSGRQNAKVFAKQVRTKSKVSQVHPDETHVEDLDDGFFTQKQLESSEGAKSAELLRQHSNVAVAWDGPRPATGGDFSPPLMHQSSSLSPGLVHQSSNLQVQSVRTTVSLPRAPGRGGLFQGRVTLSGYSSLENSKMNLSGSFKGALFNAAPNTLAESAAVSRSMSKALRSTARPVSRGQQTPVRPSHA
eukprot:g19693.t1